MGPFLPSLLVLLLPPPPPWFEQHRVWSDEMWGVWGLSAHFSLKV